MGKPSLSARPPCLLSRSRVPEPALRFRPERSRIGAVPCAAVVCPRLPPAGIGLEQAAGSGLSLLSSLFYPRPVLRAVVFDVDFTLARPGPDLGPDGYRALGLRYGLELDPARYDQARVEAFAEVKRHPELDHDEEIWILFTERIIIGMGGPGDTYAAAVEMERRWSDSVHFELYDDALPVLDALRGRGLKIGLLSNSSRDLLEFVT